MPNNCIVRIAVPSPLRRCFDYLASGSSSSTIQLGQRVRVEFGRQQLIGVVIELPASSELALEKLRPIGEILDAEPLLDPQLLELCKWASRYYQHPLGEVIHAALPVPMRNGSAAELPVETVWQLSVEGLGLPEGAPKSAPKQALLLALLRRGALTQDAIEQAGHKRTMLKALATKGLVEAIHTAPRQSFDAPLAETALRLNSEQQTALDAIPLTGFQVGLLDGVTGSGKTEVYLQAIERQLAAGRQALVLVPEIGLTPQTVARFQRRFAVPIGLIHSGVADGARNQAWLRARAGLDRIIIGTRSAVFTPLKHPGIIIVDEEHDGSYKQQEGFRYSARDLAVFRAQQLQIPLLMGSATPSLESLHNARSGRYQHLHLTQRAAGIPMPHMHLIDIRAKPLQSGLSEQALTHMKQALGRSEQVLVFINRRGFAPLLMCHHCGWQANCPRCDVRMTLHRSPPHLRCHQCDHQRRVPSHCPECRSQELQQLGNGTERSEEFLAQALPNIPILRIDRDSTRSQKSFNLLLEQIHSNQPCVLVGTQMLAKGHHFPAVSTVVIVDADGGLFSADFRATERMAQLIVQVSGRAGREDLRGQVLLQSHQVDHPYLQLLLNSGYGALADALTKERRRSDLPPFGFLAILRAESKRPENATQFLQQARDLAQRIQPPRPEFRYLGPLPAALEKRQDRFRFILQLQSLSRPQLQRMLPQWIAAIEALALAKRVRWSIDVDPQETT